MKALTPGLIICLVPMLLELTTCSQPSGPTDLNVALVSGSWLWISSEGGLFPRVITPPPRTIFIDTYSYFGSYSRRRNDTLVLTARYSLVNENTGILLQYADIQTYAGFQAELWDEWVSIEGDTLYLMDNGCDMYRHRFLRIH